MKYSKSTSARFMGAIAPESKIEVLCKRKDKPVLITASKLEPGHFLKSAYDMYYWRVDEVITSKRNQTGYKFTLEDRTELVVAENTLICGQFGPIDPSDKITEEHLKVDIAYYDSSSRRRFCVEYVGSKSEKPVNSARRLFNRKKFSTPTKKFYFFDQLIRFLREVKNLNPRIRIIWGCDVYPPEKKYYSFSEPRYRSTFMPLIKVTDIFHESDWISPSYIAKLNRKSFGRFTYFKVVNCEKFESRGPWIFPLFDSMHFRVSKKRDPFFKPYNRYSFLANDCPIALPNDYIDSDIGELTLPEEGEEIFPIVNDTPINIDFEDIWKEIPANEKEPGLKLDFKKLINQLAAAKSNCDSVESFYSELFERISKKDTDNL